MRRLRPGFAPPGLDSLFRDGVAAGLTDKELLKRFATRRDQAGELAFSTLVARHGPMVLNVCRRMLRDPADADDAFQATFLVLVRRAASIRLGNSLGPWLHGVSVRVARRVQIVGARRCPLRLDEDLVEAIPERSTGANSDLRLAIDEALAQLPAGYRSAIVLCYFEGLTHEEAADRLSCPVGTVRSRLARGRALLRQRLERSGLAPSAWMSNRAAQSDFDAAQPVVATHLIETTARAATRLAAGQPLAGTVPARLAELVAGVTRTMTISKYTTFASLLAVAALAAWGVSGLAGPQTPVAKPAPPPAPAATPASPFRTVAAAQAPIDTPKQGKAQREDRNTEPNLELLAELPAVVVNVEPKLGATDVDPAIREIRVTFSKKMKDQNWSWVTFDAKMFPKVDGKIHYDQDGRTCVLPVKLEPGRTYWIGINSERFHNFKDLNGRPALPYMAAFRTKAAR